MAGSTTWCPFIPLTHQCRLLTAHGRRLRPWRARSQHSRRPPASTAGGLDGAVASPASRGSTTLLLNDLGI